MGCKQKALYVKCCVIVCGVPDYHGDVLDATDIKKIFTTFNNQNNFEIHHNEIPLTDVSLMENYISTDDEVIAGTTVPKGSWNAVIRVDNPMIKNMLLNNDFGGVSLNNRVQTVCSTGLEGAITYSQLADAECVIPVYISFVDFPANDVGLHIMDYNVYIHKSKNGENNNMSLLEDLKALINKAEEEEEVEESSTEETIDVEATDDSEEEEPVEKETTEEEDVEEEEKKEDANIQKLEDSNEEIVEESTEFDAETEIQKLKEEILALKKIIEENNPIDETVTAEDTTDEPIITKSAKVNVVESKTENVQNFYTLTGRDSVTGKRIRNPKKILN